MRIEHMERVKAFTIFDAKGLDAISVVLQDVGPGCGRLIVECYGMAWSGYWGAIGDRDLRTFLVDCNPGYIAGKMHPNDRKVKKSEAVYLDRIIDAVHSALRSNALGEGRERGILREASSGEAATSTDGLGVAVPPAPTFGKEPK